MVDAGIVVVFSAGNDGGDGGGFQTNSLCGPEDGLLCVANHDDEGTGTRDGGLSDSSSRGMAGVPSSYPDIAAPGTDITSTCRVTLPVCRLGSDVLSLDNEYATISGTSMSAPHIAGIVAQLLQANPSLTPAEFEDILEDTARKISFGAPYGPDPANPGSTTSFDKGHGLVDVVAAVAEALRR